MVGPHAIRVTALMSGFPAWTTSRVFTITIVDACLTTTITPPSNFGTDQYYWYTTAPITRPFDNFLPALAYCPMSYQLVN